MTSAAGVRCGGSAKLPRTPSCRKIQTADECEQVADGRFAVRRRTATSTERARSESYGRAHRRHSRAKEERPASRKLHGKVAAAVGPSKIWTSRCAINSCSVSSSLFARTIASASRDPPAPPPAFSASVASLMIGSVDHLAGHLPQRDEPVHGGGEAHLRRRRACWWCAAACSRD